MKKKYIILIIWAFLFIIFSGINAGNFTTLDFINNDGRVVDILKAHKFAKQNKLILIGRDNILIWVNLDNLDNKIIKLDLSEVNFKSVNCLTGLSSSEILLGTDKGVYLLSLITKQLIPFDKTLPNSQVNDLQNFNDYIVIVFKKNVIAYKQRFWKTIVAKNFEYLDDFIKVISDRFGILWLVGEKGIVPLNKDVRKIKPLNKKIRNAVVDNNGLLYVLTNKAVYHFNGKEWIRLTDNNKNFNNLGIDNSNSLLLFNDREFGILLGNTIKKIQRPEILNREKCLKILNNEVDKTYFISQKHLIFQKDFSRNILKSLPEFLEEQSLFLLADDDESTRKLIKKIDGYYENFENSTQIKWLEILIERISDIGDEVIPLQTIRNRILLLNSNNTKIRLLKKLVRAAQVVSPELSFSFQMEMIKSQTLPEKIIKNKIKLAELFKIYNENTISNAIYQDIYQKFSLNIKGVDWAIYKTLENNKHCDLEILKEKLFKNSTDPIVHIKARYYKYKNYLEKLLVKKYQNSLSNFVKIDLNNSTIWNIHNGNGACYLTNHKKQIFICSPDSPKIKLISNKTSILEAISSKLGDLALTSRNEIVELYQGNIQKLNFKLPRGIKSLYLSKNIPVFNTKNRVFFYSLKSEQLRSFSIPGELRSFNFLQICSQNEDDWIFVTNSQVFIYNINTKRLKSIPLPITVIKITDALMDIGGFLYIGTNSGLYLYHNEKWLRQDASTGFLGNRIQKIKYQPQGDIMIVEADSAFFLRQNNFWFALQTNKYIDSKIKWIAADSRGYIYILTKNQLWIWNAQEGNGPLILLTASIAAEKLTLENRVKELAEFLNHLTSNSFTGEWAYQFRGRVLLKLNNFKEAYDQFQYGVKLFKQRRWFSDTSFVALIYDLLQKNAWQIARQTTDLMFSVYPKSHLKEYLFNIFLEKCEIGPFNESLKDRIETIIWLRKVFSSQINLKSTNELLNFLLVRNLYLNSFSNGAVNLLEQAVSENGAERFKLLWQYLILNSEKRRNTKSSNDATLFGEELTLSQMPNNFVSRRIGSLIVKKYFESFLQF